MKRILKYLLLIIVVLAAGSPYFAGRIIEKDYNALIDHLNAASQGSAKFVGKYNRGFFSSTATTEVTVQDSYINVQLAHAIKHGPVIFDFQGWTTPKTYMPQRYIFGEIKTKFMGPLEQALENLYGKSPAYDITTVITMHGAFNTDINSYPLNTSLGNGKFNWQGLTANINTTLQLETIHGTATIPLISYSEQTAKDNESANVTNLKLDFTHAPAAQNSNFDLSIETASIMNGAQNDVSLQKYVINATRKVTNDVVDMDLKTTFDKAAVGDQVYGPFDCDVQMKNLDGKALQAMMQGADSAKEYNQHLQELFAKQVTVDGKFTLTTPDGHIAISGHTMLGGPEFNIADAMTKTLTADEDVQVSKKIVYILLAKYAETQLRNREVQYFMSNKTSNIKNPYTMTPQQKQVTISKWVTAFTDELVKENLLAVKGEDYICKINYADNQLTVNGTLKTQAEINKLQPMLEVVKTPIAAAGTTVPPDASSGGSGTGVAPVSPKTPATKPTVPGKVAPSTAPSSAPVTPAVPVTPAAPTTPTATTPPQPPATPGTPVQNPIINNTKKNI